MTLRATRGLTAALAGAAALALSLPFPTAVRAAAMPVQVPHLPGAPVCGPSTADPNQPTAGKNEAPQGPDYFAADLPRFNDSVWGLPVGGFGGLRRDVPLRHTPVVFVHGQQADAQNWLDVMVQFQNQAHYTMQEMYALSYGGLGNYAGGTPVQHLPTALDQAYITQNTSGATSPLTTGGKGDGDDDSVPQLCRFVELVQWYTGSAQIDIVTHSLGDTIARKFMQLYPSLAKDVVAFVGIAGANHGTTICSGLDTLYYGCNEIAPGTPWLAALNGPGGSRETYGPTQWMTVYDGAGVDPYYAGPNDHDSPRLLGADNRTFPDTYHNDLRVGAPEVNTYLSFLLRHGQAGPGASPGALADAAAIDAAPARDTTRDQTLCGVTKLTGDVPGCPPLPVAGAGGTGSNPGVTGGGLGTIVPNTAGPPADRGGGAAAGAAALITLLAARRRRAMRRRWRTADV